MTVRGRAAVLALALVAAFAFAPVSGAAAKHHHPRHHKKKHHRRRKRKPARPVAPAAAPGPSYTGRFTEQQNSFTFSQAPSWSPDGKRVADHELVDGVQQITTRNLDGSDPVCITCGQPGANMVASYRPQGDKILYHSWAGKSLKVGSPGFGGIGAEVWVANADGSGHAVNLTKTGEGEDNYHAYFSPDGKHISWTHLNCNFITEHGTCQMEILLADYVDDANDGLGPHIENTRVIRPEDDHFYETQLWAPDGSGFLYTESVDNSLNLELFFYRLSDGHIERLTHNAAWDEQAVFTPDMKHVIFQSTRDHPGAFNTYRNLADALGVDPSTDFLTVLPVFEVAFLQPIAAESSDLYELDVASGAVRRLTTDGDQGWISPEFNFDPHSGRLLWTELRFPDGLRTQLPIDIAKQAGELGTYLLSGAIIPDQTAGNVGLDSVFGLEKRTMIGSYSGS